MFRTDFTDIETRALRSRLSGDRVILAGLRLLLLLERRANFDPAQPRDGLGRWTDTGWSSTARVGDPYAETPDAGADGRVRVAGPDQWGLVDLRDDEGLDGAHTMAEHVGKSDTKMLARVRGDAWYGFTRDVVRFRDGSFSSIESANKLVDATLARNADIVDDVAAGRKAEAFVTAEFGSITGREAYKSKPRSSPYMRETTGVGVKIIHSPDSPRRFRVIIAYLRND